MKILKLGLRFWITLTSMFSFLVGWALLANAPKPNQLGSLLSRTNSGAPLPTLEPLRPLSEFQPGDNNSFQNQPAFGFQPRSQSRRFFTTGGS
jgi:hypothetical protein